MPIVFQTGVDAGCSRSAELLDVFCRSSSTTRTTLINVAPYVNDTTTDAQVEGSQSATDAEGTDAGDSEEEDFCEGKLS